MREEACIYSIWLALQKGNALQTDLSPPGLKQGVLSTNSDINSINTRLEGCLYEFLLAFSGPER